MKKRSKRYINLISKKEKNKKLNLKEIIKIIKDSPKIKFDESIDLNLRINLKQSKGGDFNLRTVAKLPHGSGKKFKVAVLCEADKISDAKKSGAELVGNEDLIETIATGKFNFCLLYTSPSPRDS